MLQKFPSVDTPVMRDLMVPAFGLGWQVYREQLHQADIGSEPVLDEFGIE